MQSAEDAEDAAFEEEQRQLDAQFPNCKFSIAISLEDLDDPLTAEKTIVVKQVYNCRCYDNAPRKTDWFVIKADPITSRVVLNELIKGGLDLECDHHFVEGFHALTDCQFEIILGS